MTDFELGRLAPVVHVTDVDAAIDTYTAAFGFSVRFRQGAAYAVLERGATQLHLAHTRAARAPCNVAHQIVTDAQAAHDACRAAGLTIVEVLRDAPWGMRTFVAEDADGNRIDVGQPLGAD